MSRARDMANLGAQAGSGLDASDITTGTLGNTVQDNITRLGTVTTGTMNNTIGSSATFPAGMIIKKSLIVYGETGGSPISTTSETYTDTGIGGSFTVKNSSSSSYLKFILEQGMTHGNNSNMAGQTDFCVTASNNTSHSDSNSLYGSLTYKNYTQYIGGSWYGR